MPLELEVGASARVEDLDAAREEGEVLAVLADHYSTRAALFRDGAPVRGWTIVEAPIDEGGALEERPPA